MNVTLTRTEIIKEVETKELTVGTELEYYGVQDEHLFNPIKGIVKVNDNDSTKLCIKWSDDVESEISERIRVFLEKYCGFVKNPIEK